MITVEFNGASVLTALSRLQRATSDISPALLEIGEVLTESTKQRFASTTAPDNADWKENKASTLENKNGSAPLTGETGILASTIDRQLSGNTLEIGSPIKYAAMQQFGGKKSDFPHLWGDIPARPFLGVSNQDETDILSILHQHLESAV